MRNQPTTHPSIHLSIHPSILVLHVATDVFLVVGCARSFVYGGTGKKKKKKEVWNQETKFDSALLEDEVGG